MPTSWVKECIMKLSEQQIKDSISEMQAQIRDYESRIRGLKADIHGMNTMLEETRSPVIIGS